MTQQPKTQTYYVKWLEEHTDEVVASSEAEAIAITEAKQPTPARVGGFLTAAWLVPLALTFMHLFTFYLPKPTNATPVRH